MFHLNARAQNECMPYFNEQCTCNEHAKQGSGHLLTALDSHASYKMIADLEIYSQIFFKNLPVNDLN